MVDSEQITSQEEEIIFSARYAAFKVWFSVIVVFAFPMWLLFRVSYLDVLRGKYIDAFLFSLVPLLMLFVTLDSILFKELLFYEDRVVKVWYLFGRRTIYYSAAKVIGPPWYLWWLSYAIRETMENGKDLLAQIPASYIVFFFPSDSTKIIGKILDYLTEDAENNPRTFRKARLPEEAICR